MKQNNDCIHFKNIDHGIECTALNCPCDLYERRIEMGKTEIIEIFGEIRRETNKAILFFDGTKEEWIPKSQIEYETPNKNKETTIEIPEWLAMDKGLI